MTHLTVTNTERCRVLFGIYTAAAAFGFTFGLSSPLFSLILEDRGINSSVVGLNGAMTSLGFIVSAPVMPPLIRKLGILRFIFIQTFLTIFVILSMRVADNLLVWFLFRLLFGASLNGLLLISETWINHIAKPESRGRTIAIYVTILAIAFAGGPTLLAFTGTEYWTPFIVMAAVMLAPVASFYNVRALMPRFQEQQSLTVIYFFRAAPTLMMAVAAVAIIDGAILVHLAIYGLKLGGSLAVAVSMVSAFMVGNALLQIPLGWIIDRLDGYIILAVCSFIGAVCSLWMPFLSLDNVIIWPLLVIWGGITYALYTIALTLLGRRFTGSNLVTANASFAMMWGIGGISGPVISGLALDVMGPIGLPLTIAATSGMLLVVVFMRHPEVMGLRSKFLSKN